MKHTKGKWLIDITNEAINKNPDFYTISVGKKKRLIALVSSMPDDTIEQINESQANLKLIAATLRMLNELILIAAETGWQHLYDLIEDITGEKISSNRMLKLSEAIKNATK